MSQKQFNTVAVIGLGQMGASLAKAFRAYAVCDELRGYDADAEQGKLLVAQGTIEQVYDSLEAACADANLVVICTPLSTYNNVAEQACVAAADDAIITDIGSIKMEAIKAVQPHLRAQQQFVPAHPIAGSEKSGAENSSGDLFQDKLFFVTLSDEKPNESEADIIALWQKIQADAQYLPSGLHDQIYALMSHMPQLLAYVCAHILLPRHSPPVEGNLHTHLRISQSDSLMWRDVLYYNREHIGELIEFYLHILGHIRNELLGGASEAEKTDQPLNAGAVLPYILASCLISTVSLYEQKLELPLHPFAAGGFNDFTKVTATDPEGILQAISAHPGDVASWLDEAEAHLQATKNWLDEGDKESLLVQLATMQQSAKMLLQ